MLSLVITLILSLPQAQAEPGRTVAANAGLLKLLSIEELKPRMVADSLRLSARVELDQKHLARIGASVTGRVSDIQAELGQAVKKG